MADSGMSAIRSADASSRSPCEVNRSSTVGSVMGTFFLATADHLPGKALERTGHLAAAVVGKDAHADGG